ncbi:MAG: HAMP domain-containing sensor histidine kinase [Stagnimonas sp.]|nr:HAMP domain-containing sensor histidine kinase [Stagnimonas sp.]
MSLTAMRLSTSARLTLINSALLATGFGSLLLVVTWLTDRFMVGHVQESVRAELRIMEGELAIDGLRGITALIELRLRNLSPGHDRLYRLEDASGRTLAGNLDQWPPTTAAPEQSFSRPSRKFPGRTKVVYQWKPVADGGRLLVGFDDIEIAQVRDRIRRAAFWSLGAVLLISLAAGTLLTRAALRRVEAIRAAAQRILEGELSHRVPARANGDEFDRLGQTLNSMLDRINTLIASVRGATDNIAHDLRSPLTRHRSRLEAALRDPPSPEQLHVWIENNLAELDQVLGTFQALLRIASVESGLLRREFSDCDAAQLARDAVDYLEPLAEEKQQRIELTVAPCPPLHGHRHLLFQLLINLLDNAIKYSAEHALITVTITCDSRGFELEVSDSGPGIPEPERQRVFERLYRLDAARNTPGLGLGLALVKAIVGLHEGSVEILDNGPGTRIRVRIPGATGPLIAPAR